MMDSEIFLNNTTRWSQFCPEAVLALKQKRGQKGEMEISLCKSANGLPNLERSTASGKYFLHSMQDPQEEAREWIKELNLDCQVLFVYGIGLGYAYDALKEWLQKPDHFLVFLEDNLEVIDHFLDTERASELLHDPRVWLYYLDPQHKILNEISSYFPLETFFVAAIKSYKEQHSLSLHTLKGQIDFTQNAIFSSLHEYQSFGLSFFNNYFRNLFCWPNSYLASRLFEKFSSVPAIICGAGPSLAKNGALLKELSDRALIFAGGTAMNAVNALGLVPHFGIGIDPNISQSSRIIMNTAYETPFFYRNRMNYEALSFVHGDRLAVLGSSGYRISAWVEKIFEIEGGIAEEGCNVINFNLAIALALGCNPIILVGVDLAYSNNQSYAPGILVHPIHNRKEHFSTKDETKELVFKKNIYGEDVSTLWKWVSESLWFSLFAINHPSLKLINATEGGLGFSGIPNMSLEDVKNQLLLKQYDFSGRIFGEIQNSRMPSSVTFDNLIKNLQEFADSLNKSAFLIAKIHDKLVHPESSNEETATLLKELHNEISYKYLLKDFDQAFQRLRKRMYTRLQIDKDLVPNDIIQTHLKELEIERMAYLLQTALQNAEIISIIIKEKTSSQVLPINDKPADPLSLSSSSMASLALERMHLDPHLHYSFDNSVLTINDAECGLSFSEPFSPDPATDRFVLYYPNGKIKCEWFYHQEKLHGPSSFYSNEGNLLAKSWFLDGLKQGKSLQYYTSQALHSIQRFKKGVFNGLQEFFFENGKLRSLIGFKEGRLHGDLLLYHANGHLARQLHFFEGKRHGIDRIWNEEGLLIIEAYFNEDRPYGLAYAWHANGVLALEISYENDSGSPLIRSWDTQGNLIAETDLKSPDYFETISRQTEALTKGLSSVVEQLLFAAPIVAKMANEGEPIADIEVGSLEEQLMLLEEDLKQLQQINSKMIFESGLDPKNDQEAIWKTPSVKREISSKLDTMVQQMDNEITFLQETLSSAIEKLDKDKNP